MERLEEMLRKNCNLIKNGTHVFERRLEDMAVFVVDKELGYDFGVPNALTRAQDTANESNKDPKGCAGCAIYGQCLPTPSVLSDPLAAKLIPAQRTSFD